MRTLLHIFVGAIAGFALGVLAPIVTYVVFAWMDPGVPQGGATPMALLTIFTAPAGAIAGAVWGYRRLHPIPRTVKEGPDKTLARFRREFAGLPLDEQRAALAELLPGWIEDYRGGMTTRTITTVVVTVVLLRAPILWIFILAYVIRTVIIALRMRALLESIRQEWGDDMIERLGVLPWSLRVAVNRGRKVPGMPLKTPSRHPEP